MFVSLIGFIVRATPNFKGRSCIYRKILEPLLRNKGYEVIVSMACAGGGKLICCLDDWIPWCVFNHGKYHIEEQYENYLISCIEPRSVIFDIGANVGYYTIQFGRVTGNLGAVHAFEPVSYQHDLLQRNIKLNKLKNITTNKLIVSNSNGFKDIYFHSKEYSGCSSIDIQSGTCENVQSVTLDSYCKKLNIDKIDIVKIDVEGHELKVLEGMGQLLKNGRVVNIFLEINDNALNCSNVTAENIVTYLESFGYHAYSIASGVEQSYQVGSNESLVLFKRDLSY